MGLVSELLREAHLSSHRESFKVTQSRDTHRIGVGYRHEEEEFFVEVIIKVCRGDSVDIDHLNELVQNLRILSSFGYSLRCEDDNSLYAEKIVDKNKVSYELDMVSGIW